MNINLTGFLNQTGYGTSTLNILLALDRLGHDIALWPIGPVEVPQEHVQVVQKAINNTSFYDVEAPSLRICHEFDLAQHVGSHWHIGFPIFELDSFSPRALHHLRQQHKLIVASAWAREILIKNGLPAKSIFVAPLGVDREIFSPHLGFAPKEKTVFLACGKFEYRKGHFDLLQAFERAFSPSDNVELVVNCYNPCLPAEYSKSWGRSFEQSPIASRIRVIHDRLPSQKDLARLISSVDCGVFPSRAEGWGLGALECMAMGKIVILTDYSGHTEYATKENSLLIQVDELEEAHDGIFFKGGQGQWAKFGGKQMWQLIEHMKFVHKNKQNGGPMVNVEGIKTGEVFSWNRTAEAVLKAIF